MVDPQCGIPRPPKDVKGQFPKPVLLVPWYPYTYVQEIQIKVWYYWTLVSQPGDDCVPFNQGRCQAEASCNLDHFFHFVPTF